MNVLVTGGTGVLGRCVVGRLIAAGHSVRVLTREPSRASIVRDVEPCAGDLRELASLRPALSDVETVGHCASDIRSPDEVDVAGTSNLATAIQGLDVGHLVYVSIVGVDRIPITYYRTKPDVEAGAAGKAAGLGGPRVTLHDLASTWLSATGRRFRPLVLASFPGGTGRAFTDGANLCPEQSSAGPTWTQYLQGSHSPEGAVR